MTIFKNIYTPTCTFTFNGQRVTFNGETEVADKGIIEALKQAPDFVQIGFEESGQQSNTANEGELEELKKYADELGLKYHPNIGLDKLQAKIDEHLDK